MANLFVSGFINGANATQSFFSNGRDPTQVRSYDAVPLYAQYVDFDQQAEITEVFHLLFGAQHSPADVGNLQVNITVLNKVGGVWGAGGPYLYFQIWERES